MSNGHDPYHALLTEIKRAVQSGSQPFPAEHTGVITPGAKVRRQAASGADVVLDVIQQSAKGLARGGIHTMFAPADVAEVLPKMPVPTPFIPLQLASVVAQQTGLLDQIKEVKKTEMSSLDAFYGRPQTTAGRAAALAGEVAGSSVGPAEVAVAARAPVAAARKGLNLDALKRLSRDLDAAPVINFEESVGSFRPITAPTPKARLKEISQEFQAAREKRHTFLDPLRGQYVPKEGGRDVLSVDYLDELMNRLAFGRPRGPIVHPERQIGPTLAEAGGFDSPEVARFLHPDLLWTERTIPKTPAEMARLKQVRHIEDVLNAGVRTEILENRLPAYFRSPRLMREKESPVEVRNIFNFLLKNEKGEIPLGPIDEQLKYLKGLRREHPSVYTDEQIAWAFDRQDLMPDLGNPTPWKAVLKDGTVVRGSSQGEAIAQGTYQYRLKEYPALGAENAQEATGRVMNFFKEHGELSWSVANNMEIVFENRFGQDVTMTEYAKEIKKIRDNLTDKFLSGGRAGLPTLAALAGAGAVGTTIAAKREKKKR